MSRDFDGAHEILKWRTVCSHIFQITCFFSRFIEDRTTIYWKFLKKCSPEFCRVSTAQFMTAVQIEEPKEFSWCPRQRMMQTEDGVTSGSERLIMKRTTRARSISTPRKLKYVSIALWILSYTLETSSHILKTMVYEMLEITGDRWISFVGFSPWWNFLSIWKTGRRALRIYLETTAKMQEHACSPPGRPIKASSLPSNLPLSPQSSFLEKAWTMDITLLSGSCRRVLW